MSEAMTVETIIEAYWQMQGFWTRTRFPLQTRAGGWSDIDVLAYKPESRALVIAESKVRGPKKAVFAYTKDSRKRYGNILDYDWHDDDYLYFGFLRHIKQACTTETIFRNFDRMVRKLIVHLASNYAISDEVKLHAEATVYKKIRKAVPERIALEVRLDSTLDVISKIITLENENTQGRRYGHPVIDIARELNRYMRPQVHYAGGGRAGAQLVRNSFKRKLSQAMGM